MALPVNNDIHNFKILTVHSVIAYLFGYLVVFFAYNSITILVALFYEIKTILYHHKLLFLTSDYSTLWNVDSACYVFSAGSIFLALAILALIRVYKYYEDYEGLMKIFLFWIILHSINRIIGFFIAGTIWDLYASNVVLDWLYVEYWLRILFVVGAIFLIFGIGSKTTKPLLRSSISFKFVESRKRLFFIWSQAFRTWFIATVIIFLINLPEYAYMENFLSVTMFFFLFPSYFNHQTIPIPLSDNKNEEPKYPIPWRNILYISLLLLLFRLIFS